MHTKIIEILGKKLYLRTKKMAYRRYFVFRLRCAFHDKDVGEVINFFHKNDLRKNMLMANPAFLDQVTRKVFYKNSTWLERKSLVFNHITILEKLFTDQFMEKIYIQGARMTIWEDLYQGKPIKMQLWFHDGQRKEGCLSLVLHYEGKDLFQIMFWLNKDKEGVSALYIGALQGPRNGSEIIKGLTKAFYGYRPKNLIFYGIRNIAEYFGTKKIYAVCNEGYYAMNHIRIDRKLKTDFSIFWQECEGKLSSDKRFYDIPIKEYRKSMEELKPSKRAQHRRRFEKMDQVKRSIFSVLSRYKKSRYEEVK